MLRPGYARLGGLAGLSAPLFKNIINIYIYVYIYISYIIKTDTQKAIFNNISDITVEEIRRDKKDEGG